MNLDKNAFSHLKIRFYVPIFHISAFTLIPERKGYVYVQQGKMWERKEKKKYFIFFKKNA